MSVDGEPAVARRCDELLDFLLLAFAAWTVVYHVCLVLHVSVAVASAVHIAALAPCAWLAFRRCRMEARDDAMLGRGLACGRRLLVLRAGHLLAAICAAALFAFGYTAWRWVWLLWVLAAGTALVVTVVAPADRVGEGTAGDERHGRLAAGTALAWAAALGGLSLFLLRPDGDDTQYVRLSTWIAAHGELPLRDVIFSDQVFPAVIYPPVPSFEALVGAVARFTDIPVPDLVYLVVPPLASAFAVLATWRLLRAWQVPLTALALSAAMVFLLLDAIQHRAFGSFFIGRIWQGKVIFLAVLVPLLFALLAEYAERPTRRRLLLLGAAGAAGVGLTSSATFVVPAIAAGCLAPVALRSLRRAAVGLAASAAYPLGAGVVAVALAGHGAEPNPYVPPARLVHFVLADGGIAFVALLAVLAAPVLLRRGVGGRMAAATALLVALLYTPPVTELIFDATGLGRALWRLSWALPVAALVGVLATGAGLRSRSPALRALPAVGLCAVLVGVGTPLWSAEARTTVTSEPTWKRSAESVAASRRILAHARVGDTILAPADVEQTLLVMSADVTTVAAREFYAYALEDVPGGQARARVVLAAFARDGLGGRLERFGRPRIDAEDVVAALGDVPVDIACSENRESVSLLEREGFVPLTSAGDLRCLRAPSRPAKARRR